MQNVATGGIYRTVGGIYRTVGGIYCTVGGIYRTVGESTVRVAGAAQAPMARPICGQERCSWSCQ